mmetsp:Transcript_45559/g.121155  ORF Transcript_45559/g.121155 Transcript_45559/m.121155 type:complete len:84 (-) Transcript_45559:302-553(-)
MMYSVLGGTAFGIMEAVRRSPAVKVGNVAVGTFSVVALFSWFSCRNAARQRQEAIQKSVHHANLARQHAAEGAAPAADAAKKA